MTERTTRRLTDLELEVMHAVWGSGRESVTVRDVVEYFAAHDGPELAYTTVQTVMNILRRKGALASRPGPGRAHLYTSAVSREQAMASMTDEFVTRLFHGQAEPLLTRLIEHESVDRETLAELKRAIEDHLEDEGGEGPEGGAR